MSDEPEHLSVLIADERREFIEPITNAVENLGHEVCCVVTETDKVGRSTHEHQPDIAIVALHEDSRHALELISGIVDEATCPVCVLAPVAGADFIADAARRGVFAHLDSTDEQELRGGIDIAVQRYHQFSDLLGAFRRRARIERAKGVLMERDGLGEQEAFDRMRSEARDSRRPLMDIVDGLID